jgi:hypothetical protein
MDLDPANEMDPADSTLNSADSISCISATGHDSWAASNEVSEAQARAANKLHMLLTMEEREVHKIARTPW